MEPEGKVRMLVGAEKKGQTAEGNDSQSDAENFNTEQLESRFYRDKWPSKGDLVVVEITQVNQEGAYVRLLEYDGIEGLILASSVSTKRIKNVKQFLRVGTQDIMTVVQLDQKDNNQAYIDLSKRNLQVQDVEEKRNYFEKSKIVHLIMRLTAYNLKISVFDLYEQWGWDFYDNFDHAYDALKLCLTDPDFVFGKIDISDEHKEALLFNIKKKLAAAPIKLRTIFKLSCFTFDGINAIRQALLATKEKQTDERFEVCFQMIVSPEYKAEIVTLDKHGGIECLNNVIVTIAAEMKARGGMFKLVQAPTKIGSNRAEFDSDLVRQKAAEIDAEGEEEENADSSSEDNEEGMDLDLEDGMIQDDDEDTNSTAVSEKA